jgi:hypothetical protein
MPHRLWAGIIVGRPTEPRVTAMTPLSAPSRQFVGVATIMAIELVASHAPNAAAIDSAVRVWPMSAGERIVT